MTTPVLLSALEQAGNETMLAACLLATRFSLLLHPAEQPQGPRPRCQPGGRIRGRTGFRGAPGIFVDCRPGPGRHLAGYDAGSPNPESSGRGGSGKGARRRNAPVWNRQSGWGRSTPGRIGAYGRHRGEAASRYFPASWLWPPATFSALSYLKRWPGHFLTARVKSS